MIEGWYPRQTPSSQMLKGIKGKKKPTQTIFIENFTASIYHTLQCLRKQHPVAAANATYSC